MLTKYTITIGATEYDVPEECLKNWGDISFSLKRTDFSGVMRSYSAEFVFVGAIRELLWGAYLAQGVKAAATIAVYTYTDTHEWEKQHEAALDFSTLEDDGHKLSINALDDTLAARLKSMKGQKWQFPISQFETVSVQIERMSFANCAKYTLPNPSNVAGIVDARVDNTASTVISTEYVEPTDASSGYDGRPVQRHFASINKYGATIHISVQASVRCYLNPSYSAMPNPDDHIAEMLLGVWDGTLSVPRFVSHATLFDNDISKKRISGIVRNLWVGKLNHRNYATLDELKAAAAESGDGIFPGTFGIVGSATYPNESYWTDNDVYEYDGSTWSLMGQPALYYKDRALSATHTFTDLLPDKHFPMLQLTYGMIYTDATMTMTWSDPARIGYAYYGIRPLQLLQAIVGSIDVAASASIAEDSAGLLAKTYLFPAESLRRMAGAKVYSTFQQFAEWMSAVFGYTYRIVGNEVQFVHRSAVFNASIVKSIDSFSDFKYTINDNLIYSEVDAGYSKKEYGEINGKLETNFTNYYATGFSLNDKKLSLISKYRADAYGIEFALRKGEKSGDTTDDRNDEDVFFAFADLVNGSLLNSIGDNTAYAPSVCVANNAGYIAAMGNGVAFTLSMTSSDGNNELADISIPAGAALFSIGEVEFSTDDMTEPADLNGLVSVERDGYRYTGFISEATARYGRQNGMEYTLIAKDITML